MAFGRKKKAEENVKSADLEVNEQNSSDDVRNILVKTKRRLRI